MSDTEYVSTKINNRNWGIFFIIVLLLVVIGIVIYLSFVNIPPQYGEWLVRAGPCIQEQQLVTMTCSNPEQGCQTEFGPRVTPQYTTQKCDIGDVSAKWFIEQTDTSTKWICVSTGRKGSNLCTFAQQGTPILSRSIDMRSFSPGTIKEVKSIVPENNPETKKVNYNNIFIWSKECNAISPNDRPLAEGWLGNTERPLGLNYNSLNNGAYNLNIQLCRKFPNLSVCDENIWSKVVNRPVSLILDNEWLVSTAYILPTIDICQKSNNILALVLDVENNYWLYPNGKKKKLFISYPYNNDSKDSLQVIKDKGVWLMKGPIEYQEQIYPNIEDFSIFLLSDTIYSSWMKIEITADQNLLILIHRIPDL